jgi:hypothetical protein
VNMLACLKKLTVHRYIYIVFGALNAGTLRNVALILTFGISYIHTFCMDSFAVCAGLPDAIGIFKPKIPIWVNFGASCNGKVCFIPWPFGTFYGHLVIFGTFPPFWYIPSV